jgi:LuxR family transcriptional regulator, maltose regulon positive regulatory protein
MSTPILATKLYIPPTQPKVIPRPRLIEQLNEGVHSKLILISASAGFGKTTLVSEWIDDLRLDIRNGSQLVNQKYHDATLHPDIGNRVAWLSLDEGDNDPTRFLVYLVAALQTIAPTIGEGVATILQSPQPPPTEAILTALLNEIASPSASSTQGISAPFLLILDDYHCIDAASVDHALTFLLDHMPPQMHLVITTREDPSLPLSRYRVRGQLTEIRATDLRFTLDETAAFLNQAMGLNLSAEDIAALETRTEGWIAGLQLAALSMQRQENSSTFIQSFTGSHRFVLDYLVEEVLHQQPQSIQTFLLHTAILDRLCGSLCDAVLQDSTASGQETLAYLERANLFLIPLDDERRWYRYHHLFADLLRQRLHQERETEITALHGRASIWFEENGLEIEAFQHAATANDVERAERLMEGNGMPLLFRGAVAPVMNWLASLETAVLAAHPSLCVTYASALLLVSQISGVEEKLQVAEAALEGVELDDETRNLIGRIASMRATVAVAQNQVDIVRTQSERALEYLHPDNLPVRTSIIWNLGYVSEIQGDREAAKQAYTEAMSTSEAIGHFIIHIMSTMGLGGIQEGENQLHQAAETYQKVLKLVGDPPLSVACAAHLGLARIAYEWNDLEAAQQHAQQSLLLAKQFQGNIDREVASQVFLARLKLVQGEVAEASTLLYKASEDVQHYNFIYRVRELTAVHVQTLLQQGNLTAADQLAHAHDFPLSQARVHLAQGNPAQALAVLASYRQQMEAKGWADELLKVMVLQTVAFDANGDGETAVSLLNDALTAAEPEGFIRTFIDEGQPIAELLLRMKDEGRRMNDYIHKLLVAFDMQFLHPSSLRQAQDDALNPQPLVEPLSGRELEVLQLVAQGLSNREISEQLFLAIDTVKGHNRRIFGKLQVQNRTEAARRARELGLV